MALELQDLMALKSMSKEDGMTPYQSVKLDYMASKNHTSGIGVAGLVTGVAGLTVGATAWLFGGLFANSKGKEAKEAAQAAKEKAQAEEYAKKLDAVQVTVRAKAGNGGKLFGAVTSEAISKALKEQFDMDIEKNKIVQGDPIKSFGAYTVKAKLGYEVSGNINVLVVEE